MKENSGSKTKKNNGQERGRSNSKLRVGWWWFSGSEWYFGVWDILDRDCEKQLGKPLICENK